MTVDGLRKVRMAFKFGLLVALPLTGYLWAQSGVSTEAIAMSVVCIVLALGAESLASLGEQRLSQIRSDLATDAQEFEADMSSRDEKIRQMDRIVETLSNQNHDLRGKLVTLHGEMHAFEEEPAPGPPEAPAAASPAPGANGPESGGGGEVTDISSLRNRR